MPKQPMRLNGYGHCFTVQNQTVTIGMNEPTILRSALTFTARKDDGGNHENQT
jgi:hypothetical protein